MGKQAWKRQTVTAENVLMGFYSMDPASEPQGRTPSKYCERGHLHFHVFLLTFRCFFWDAMEEVYNKDASLSIHQKKKIYLLLSVACNALQIHCGR